MPQNRLRATFMRGGTSKALMLHRADLPTNQADWAPIFLAAMGSPDPNGRQLDGMGGGLSSLSKVCVVGPPTRPDADIDYTFGPVSVRGAAACRRLRKNASSPRRRGRTPISTTRSARFR